MKARVLFRRAIPALLLLGAGAVKGAEDSPKSIKPQPVELTRTAAGDRLVRVGPDRQPEWFRLLSRTHHGAIERDRRGHLGRHQPWPTALIRVRSLEYAGPVRWYPIDRHRRRIGHADLGQHQRWHSSPGFGRWPVEAHRVPGLFRGSSQLRQRRIRPGRGCGAAVGLCR